MIAIQVARIIADFTLFLQFTDEELLNLDESVEMSELLGARMDEFDKDFLRDLVDAFARIAPEYAGKSGEMVRKIPYYYYLEETLAADDPVKLAELEAQRDAEQIGVVEDTTGGHAWRADLSIGSPNDPDTPTPT